jgi:queuosine precursor transporter
MTGLQTRRRVEGMVLFAAYAACVPFANWLIGHVGTMCIPHGPCVLPVAPGLMAPSGVVAASLALILRDLVQRRLGLAWSAVAVGAGAALSAIFAPPALILASTLAFAVSETLDLAVYTPLQRRGLVIAALASSLAGLVADSLVFLTLAFGNLDLLAGQVVGKFWVVLATLPALAAVQARDRRLGLSTDPS